MGFVDSINFDYYLIKFDLKRQRASRQLIFPET